MLLLHSWNTNKLVRDSRLHWTKHIFLWPFKYSTSWDALERHALEKNILPGRLPFKKDGGNKILFCDVAWKFSHPKRILILRQNLTSVDFQHLLITFVCLFVCFFGRRELKLKGTGKAQRYDQNLGCAFFSRESLLLPVHVHGENVQLLIKRPTFSSLKLILSQGGLFTFRTQGENKFHCCQ